VDTRVSMTAEAELQRHADAATQPETRASYSAPAVTRLGTVTEMTELIKGGPSIDPGTGSFAAG
jgi:hypothetical protein